MMRRFVSAATTDDIHRALYSLPPARVYHRVPENLNQRIAFSSSIVTRRIGDAEAQRDRYAGG